MYLPLRYFKTAIRIAKRWPAALLAAACLLAYGNSFDGTFVFDDIQTIVRNPSLPGWWPPWEGIPVQRPLLFYSLAANYAFDGLQTRFYHAFNLLIHLGAALALYGVVRRTAAILGRPPDRAAGIALATALVWAVHPLQTQSVTYIIQRGEAMAGLFYLLVLYCTARGIRGKCTWWDLGAVLAFFAAVASKEVAVTAPAAALLYDRTFSGRGLRQGLQARPLLYLGAVAPLAAALLWWGGEAPRRVWTLVQGDAVQTTAWEYALGQPGALAFYLKQAATGRPLCIDHHWQAAAGPLQVWLPGLLVGSVAAIACWATVRRRPWGYAALVAFVVLAPTSSLVPLLDNLVEHRMYLPLAAVVLAGVTAGERLARRAGWPAAYIVLGVVVAVCILMTRARNEDYTSGLALWRDTLAQYPSSPRAHLNMGGYLLAAGDRDGAQRRFAAAIRLWPQYAEAHFNMGKLQMAAGDSPGAIAHYRRAVELKERYAAAHFDLGMVLATSGQKALAEEHLRRATRSQRGYAAAHFELGNLLAGRGAFKKAAKEYRQAVAAAPDMARAHHNLGSSLAAQGRSREALPHYRRALQLRPDYAEARANLAAARADSARGGRRGP